MAITTDSIRPDGNLIAGYSSYRFVDFASPQGANGGNVRGVPAPAIDQRLPGMEPAATEELLDDRVRPEALKDFLRPLLDRLPLSQGLNRGSGVVVFAF